MPSSCATSLLSLLLFLHFAPLVLISKRPFLISLLSELHPCLHHCPSSLYPFDLIHQNTYLCHPPFCHTPAFPIAPCPFLCLLFLSPALSLTSVFPPLCDSLFPSCCLPYFMSVISVGITPSWMSALSVPNSCLPLSPLPYFVLLISFTKP